MKIIIHNDKPYRTLEDLIDKLDTGEYEKFENCDGKYIECWNQITGGLELEHYRYLELPDEWFSCTRKKCVFRRDKEC